ncbi:diacylglycerol kinase (ATP) [Ectothiorhodospira mobilis]|uniref:Diacylglycerol kinase (ATP) n=1 Tax=Ectothiorhodospira mobilis TaxID=195064 RepID=A0A1I4QR65_ECTMO|nr:diacylglycerol kinase [Ectothiorhodospira mobilis]SFM42200.1 diacylglycerol kinase (ATP) [Ectothiorhodospira mobilis]
MRKRFLDSGQPGWQPLAKFRVALRGLSGAAVSDFSVLYKLLISLPIILLSLVYHPWLDSLLVILVTVVMLIAELLNTAIEALCDLVESRYDRQVRHIKDVAAAAAWIAILVWVIVLVVAGKNLVHHFMAS